MYETHLSVTQGKVEKDKLTKDTFNVLLLETSHLGNTVFYKDGGSPAVVRQLEQHPKYIIISNL